MAVAAPAPEDDDGFHLHKYHDYYMYAHTNIKLTSFEKKIMEVAQEVEVARSVRCGSS